MKQILLNHIHNPSRSLSPNTNIKTITLTKPFKANYNNNNNDHFPLINTSFSTTTITTTNTNPILLSKQIIHKHPLSQHKNFPLPTTPSTTINSINTSTTNTNTSHIKTIPLKHIKPKHNILLKPKHSPSPKTTTRTTLLTTPNLNSSRLLTRTKPKITNNTPSTTFLTLPTPLTISHSTSNYLNYKHRSKIQHHNSFKENKIITQNTNIPFLTGKCNEIEDKVVSINNNIMLIKSKSKCSMRNNKRTRTQNESKRQLNLKNVISNNNKEHGAKDEIIKDILDEKELLDNKYHKKLYSNCRNNTIRALMEFQCINSLSPTIAYQDNKNVRKYLITTNENEKYNMMLKNNYEDGVNEREEMLFWMKRKKKEESCAKKLTKQTNTIIQLMNLTIQMKEDFFNKHGKIKHK